MVTIVSEEVHIDAQDGPQYAFACCTADICIYGGAAGGGKTWGLLVEPLRNIHVPDFSAVIFRETFPQIRNEGGLWDESEKMYPLLGAEPTITRLEWKFPSGATVRFAHMDHETDKLNWQGSQIPLIGFDELTHFSKSQFFYMLSRNRSMCGVRPYVRATCNPDADSWVAEFIEWWIDQETGYAIPERSGIVRWFVRDGGILLWADDPETLIAQVPLDPLGNEAEPKSFTFIPALLEDNPALMQADPGYRANLLALPPTDQKRLLRGNWKVRSMEGAEWEKHPEYFDAHIWVDYADWPDAFELTAIALDGSGGKGKTADYSAIIFAGFIEGTIYIAASIERRAAAKIVNDMLAMSDEHEPISVGIESNGFQDLFASLLDGECDRRGIPPLPISLLHNHIKKEIRIRSLEPYLARQKLRILNNDGGKLLVSQLRGFGIADHDDGPDGLEMAVRLLNHLNAEMVA